MSSSIAIPNAHLRASSNQAVASSSGSSLSSSPMSSTAGSPAQRPSFQARRPSLLSSSISKQESTVINIGDPDGPPRLITYLSSSQGFAWNPEIFLPSYIDCDYTPIEHRREPVHDIHLSDDELKQLLPQGQ